MQLYLRHFLVWFLWTWHSERWHAECWQISTLNQLMTDTTSCIFHTRVDMNHWLFLIINSKKHFSIFHDKHYKLHISYQRWYESLLYPLWIIPRGHFCGFCVNDNTYTVRTHEPVIHLKPLCPEFILGHPNGFSENAWRSCCSFQKGCPSPRFHCTVSRCAHLECLRCAHLLTLSVLFTPN